MKKTLFTIIAIVLMALSAKAQYSGQCGDNLTWIVDESTGTLTISGTGDMWNDLSFMLGITNVVIQDGVTSIGSYAFSYQGYLVSASIPNTIVSIGDFAFYLCSSLSSVTIPNSVTTIGESAFLATGIESATLGNSVASVGDRIFCECYNLKSIVLPNSLKAIPDFAFWQCESLENVVFGDSLVSIGYGALGFCKSLTDIDLPNTLLAIGERAFVYCISLQSFDLSDSLESIDEYAFMACSALNSIEFPNSIKYLGENAFIGCTALESIRIPASLTSIGNHAFFGCDNIQEIYCMSNTPPNCLGDNVFNPAVYVNATLYVPIGCESAYKNAFVWKNFSNIVETADFIGETSEEVLSVFPNPSSDFINISCKSMKSLEIISIEGRIVMNTSVSGDNINLDVSDLPSGMYIIRITTKQGCLTKEIVKK